MHLHLNALVRRFSIAALFGLAVLSIPARDASAQGAGVSHDDTTYVFPVYEQFLSRSNEQLIEEFEKLKDRIGPEGPYVKLGFTVYIGVRMDSWTADPQNRSVIRENLADTIGQINKAITKAKAAELPIIINLLGESRGGTDGLQAGAQQADVRNTQWFGREGDALDNTMAQGWMTNSRYARTYRTKFEAYVRELGSFIAEKMQQHPNTLIAAAGNGEVEMSSDYGPDGQGEKFRTIETALLADYSPFAVAEFRDWLTASGLYATDPQFAGQAYANPYSRNDAGLAQLNADFGTAFTTWELRYFDWELGNEAGKAIPLADYNSPGFERHPGENAGGFDAARVRNPDNAWWQLWMEFRRQLVRADVTDWARWITTTADSSGPTIPATRWYSYQIPADYLFGFSPENPHPRYETSASAWWTGDVAPYGRVGITSFNFFHELCNPTEPIQTRFFCRTLQGVAPRIAERNRRFGIFEWHPGVGDNALFPGAEKWGVNDVYSEEMKLVVRYRPAVLAPYALYTAADRGQPFREKPFYDSGFEVALKNAVYQLNLGPQDTRGVQVTIDTPAVGTTVQASQSFTVTGHAVDLSTLLGSGFGPGISAVEVYDGETLLGTATYGLNRPDIAEQLGGQFNASGYSFTVTGLPVGTHELRVLARSTRDSAVTGEQTQTLLVAVLPSPTVTVTTPAEGATVAAPFSVNGSAEVAAGMTSVQLLVDGATSGSAQNCDNQTSCAFSFSVEALANGPHTVGVRAIGSQNTTTDGTVGVLVGSLFANLESPAANSTNTTGTFTISGWGVDTRTGSGTGVTKVDVAVYPLVDGTPGIPVLESTATYGGAPARGDIAALFGPQFTNSHFSASATNIADGAYRAVAVVTSAVDSSTTTRQSDFTVSRPPGDLALWLDSPSNGATTTQNFTIGGWAIDMAEEITTGVSAVTIEVYPLTNGSLGSPVLQTSAAYGGSRPDIGAAFGANFTNSGFTANASNIANGTYRVVAVATSSFDGKTMVAQADIIVARPAGNLLLWIDSPLPNSTTDQSFTVAGWSLDTEAPAGTGVTAVNIGVYPLSDGVTGTPVLQGAATYGGQRSDLIGVFGTQSANSGFSFAVANIPPGTYRVIASATSTFDGATRTDQRDITVTGPVSDPFLIVDTPSAGSVSRTFSVQGWAIDRGAPAGTGIDQVHVWAIPVGGGNAVFTSATYGSDRSDIAALFDNTRFRNSGYSASVTLPDGTWDISVYARSTLTNSFVITRVVRVVITTVSNVVMWVDAPTVGSTQPVNMAISGWAVDSGAESGTGVSEIHIWAYEVVDNVRGTATFVGVAVPGLARPDIGAYFGPQFTNSGFSMNAANLSPGKTYDLDFYPKSTVTNGFALPMTVRVTTQ